MFSNFDIPSRFPSLVLFRLSLPISGDRRGLSPKQSADVHHHLRLQVQELFQHQHCGGLRRSAAPQPAAAGTKHSHSSLKLTAATPALLFSGCLFLSVCLSPSISASLGLSPCVSLTYLSPSPSLFLSLSLALYISLHLSLLLSALHSMKYLLGSSLSKLLCCFLFWHLHHASEGSLIWGDLGWQPRPLSPGLFDTLWAPVQKLNTVSLSWFVIYEM